MKLVWLVLVVAACSDLEATQRNDCGNDILEPGEDCDGAAYCTELCTVRCAPELEGVPQQDRCHGLPGYVCGVDGTCQTPGGRLEFTVVDLPFAPAETLVADIDHDGIGDVLGVNSTSIEIHHGTVDGRLERREVLRTPGIRGSVAVADLDSDGYAEVVAPTIDGLVSYSSRYATLAAEPFPADTSGAPFVTEAVIALDAANSFDAMQATRLGIIAIDDDMPVLTFRPVDVEAGTVSTEFALSCAIDATKPLLRLDVTKYSPPSPDGFVLETVFVVAFQQDDGAGACAFSMTFDGYAMDPYTFKPLALPLQGTRPVLLDLGGDTCPELAQEVMGEIRILKGQRTTTTPVTCVFPAGLPRPTLFFPTTAPLRLPVGRVRSSASPYDELVVTSGIYQVDSAAMDYAWPVYEADRRLTQVASGDFNGDDAVDVVLAAENSPDLDVLMRNSTPYGFDGFLRILMTTEGVPTRLLVGDFDGNRLPDILFSEDGGDPDHLLVAYNTSDRLLDPVRAASFNEVVSIAPIQLADASDPVRAVLDIVVLDRKRDEKPRITAIHGSPSRTLLPVFSPPHTPTFRNVVVGDLDGMVPSDLLAFGGFGGDSMLRLLGLPTGGLSFDGNMVLNPTAQICRIDGGGGGGGTVPPNGEVQCADQARHVMDGRQLFAFDNAGFVATLDPSPKNCNPEPPTYCEPNSYSEPKLLSTLTNDPDLLTSFPIDPRAPRVFDVDGDGTPEILFGYRTEKQGSLVACDLLLSTCKPIADYISTDGTVTCIDAAPGVIGVGGRNVDPPKLALIVLCVRDSFVEIYRLEGQGGDVVVSLLVDPTPFPAIPRSIQVADVTGDRLDDVLVVLDSGILATRHLIVMRQQTSSETAGGGSVTPMEQPGDPGPATGTRPP